MILVVTYHIAERNDIAAVIQIGHFHKVIAHFFQNVQQVVFTSGLLIGIRVFKIRPCQIGAGISHCVRELQMVSCIVIAAGHIYRIRTAVCRFDRCHGAGGQSLGTAQRCFCIIGMTLSTPGQHVVICAALVCVKKVQRQFQCVSVCTG